MRLSTQGSSQVHSVFGGGYVSEQRGDETRRHLPPLDDEDDDETVLDFSKMLDSLRAALSLR
jgi:hypothetical protein